MSVNDTKIDKQQPGDKHDGHDTVADANQGDTVEKATTAPIPLIEHIMPPQHGEASIARGVARSVVDFLPGLAQSIFANQSAEESLKAGRGAFDFSSTLTNRIDQFNRGNKEQRAEVVTGLALGVVALPLGFKAGATFWRAGERALLGGAFARSSHAIGSMFETAEVAGALGESGPLANRGPKDAESLLLKSGNVRVEDMPSRFGFLRRLASRSGRANTSASLADAVVPTNDAPLATKGAKVTGETTDAGQHGTDQAIATGVSDAPIKAGSVTQPGAHPQEQPLSLADATNKKITPPAADRAQPGVQTDIALADKRLSIQTIETDSLIAQLGRQHPTLSGDLQKLSQTLGKLKAANFNPDAEYAWQLQSQFEVIGRRAAGEGVGETQLRSMQGQFTSVVDRVRDSVALKAIEAHGTGTLTAEDLHELSRAATTSTSAWQEGASNTRNLAVDLAGKLPTGAAGDALRGQLDRISESISTGNHKDFSRGLADLNKSAFDLPPELRTQVGNYMESLEKPLRAMDVQATSMEAAMARQGTLTQFSAAAKLIGAKPEALGLTSYEESARGLSAAFDINEYGAARRALQQSNEGLAGWVEQNRAALNANNPQLANDLLASLNNVTRKSELATMARVQAATADGAIAGDTMAGAVAAARKPVAQTPAQVVQEPAKVVQEPAQVVQEPAEVVASERQRVVQEEHPQPNTLQDAAISGTRAWQENAAFVQQHLQTLKTEPFASELEESFNRMVKHPSNAEAVQAFSRTLSEAAAKDLSPSARVAIDLVSQRGSQMVLSATMVNERLALASHGFDPTLRQEIESGISDPARRQAAQQSASTWLKAASDSHSLPPEDIRAIKTSLDNIAKATQAAERFAPTMAAHPAVRTGTGNVPLDHDGTAVAANKGSQVTNTTGAKPVTPEPARVERQPFEGQQIPAAREPLAIPPVARPVAASLEMAAAERRVAQSIDSAISTPVQALAAEEQLSLLKLQRSLSEAAELHTSPKDIAAEAQSYAQLRKALNDAAPAINHLPEPVRKEISELALQSEQAIDAHIKADPAFAKQLASAHFKQFAGETTGKRFADLLQQSADTKLPASERELAARGLRQMVQSAELLERLPAEEADALRKTLSIVNPPAAAQLAAPSRTSRTSEPLKLAEPPQQPATASGTIHRLDAMEKETGQTLEVLSRQKLISDPLRPIQLSESDAQNLSRLGQSLEHLAPSGALAADLGAEAKAIANFRRALEDARPVVEKLPAEIKSRLEKIELDSNTRAAALASSEPHFAQQLASAEFKLAVKDELRGAALDQAIARAADHELPQAERAAARATASDIVKAAERDGLISPAESERVNTNLERGFAEPAAVAPAAQPAQAAPPLRSRLAGEALPVDEPVVGAHEPQPIAQPRVTADEPAVVVDDSAWPARTAVGAERPLEVVDQTSDITGAPRTIAGDQVVPTAVPVEPAPVAQLQEAIAISRQATSVGELQESAQALKTAVKEYNASVPEGERKTVAAVLQQSREDLVNRLWRQAAEAREALLQTGSGATGIEAARLYRQSDAVLHAGSTIEMSRQLSALTEQAKAYLNELARGGASIDPQFAESYKQLIQSMSALQEARDYARIGSGVLAPVREAAFNNPFLFSSSLAATSGLTALGGAALVYHGTEARQDTPASIQPAIPVVAAQAVKGSAVTGGDRLAVAQASFAPPPEALVSANQATFTDRPGRAALQWSSSLTGALLSGPLTNAERESWSQANYGGLLLSFPFFQRGPGSLEVPREIRTAVAASTTRLSSIADSSDLSRPTAISFRSGRPGVTRFGGQLGSGNPFVTADRQLEERNMGVPGSGVAQGGTNDPYPFLTTASRALAGREAAEKKNPDSAQTSQATGTTNTQPGGTALPDDEQRQAALTTNDII